MYIANEPEFFGLFNNLFLRPNHFNILPSETRGVLLQPRLTALRLVLPSWENSATKFRLLHLNVVSDRFLGFILLTAFAFILGLLLGVNQRLVLPALHLERVLFHAWVWGSRIRRGWRDISLFTIFFV